MDNKEQITKLWELIHSAKPEIEIAALDEKWAKIWLNKFERLENACYKKELIFEDN